MWSTIRLYVTLAKPGVLFGNAITVAAGFLFASAGRIDWVLLVMVFVGSSFVIGSACAFNNALDADIDQKMNRTKKRAVAAGLVKPWKAAIFAAILAVVGFVILRIFANWLVVATGVIGWIIYVWAYGMWSKRLSPLGTLVGAVSGAMPIVGGYLAVTPHLDVAAILLFISLTVWQLPEFYSIGIYRRPEYAAAGIPILPVVAGVERTQKDIFIATIIFVVSSLLLTVFGYTGALYLIIMGAAGIYWIWLGWQGFSTKNAEQWARQMFKFAITILLLYSAMLAIGPVLP
jgi:protoheme IX farnesyltransferase